MPTSAFINKDLGPIGGGIAAVTPSDATTYDPPIRIYVGGAGNVAVTFPDASTAVLTGIATGVWHPMVVSKVLATGTTATTIIGATA